MPTREQLLAEAQRMFAKTISLDDIVDRAHELLNEAVGFLLAAPAPALATNPKSGANGSG
jgi:stearoyl-CoA desaturase (delta-9 desaturase)